MTMNMPTTVSPGGRPYVTNGQLAPWSALLMILSGIALSAAGFVRDPLGEISDSVLWFVAQGLVYAGSVFGVTVYIDHKLEHLRSGR